MSKQLRHIGQGIGFINKGYSAIKTDKVLFLVALIPMFINITLFLLAYNFNADLIEDYIQKTTLQVVGDSEGFLYSLMYYPLSILLKIIAFFILVFLTFAISSIVASPFHSYMAERLIAKYANQTEEAFHFKQWLQLTVKMFLTSLKKSLVFLVLGLVLFVCSFIPVVNVIASFLGCVIIAFDSMDYAFEVKQLNFSERKSYFRTHTNLFWGMGGVVTLTALVPGLTLLTQPLMVAGSTVLFCENSGGSYDSRGHSQ